jgi:hypothetical protein
MVKGSDPMIDSFPPEVQGILGIYVYRLIDPRNGQTFYVGKGKGNRVFQHMKLDPVVEARADSEEDDDESLKVRTIREIWNAGLQPLHVIHRHGLDNDKTAFEVEAALMDAYPGLTNIAGGYRNNERGCRHAEEIVRIHTAKAMVALEDLILIYIGISTGERRDPYSAVRCAWRMARKEAERRKLVLAYEGGLVVGAYRPEKWLPATPENFPELPPDYQPKSSRIGFIGHPAGDVWDHYVGTRPPPRKKGSQTPFSYIKAEG